MTGIQQTALGRNAQSMFELQPFCQFHRIEEVLMLTDRCNMIRGRDTNIEILLRSRERLWFDGTVRIDRSVGQLETLYLPVLITYCRWRILM